ncbi:MAG: ABC-2 family transporter protein [Pseudomonadales bacterium]|nr:ABC-2 family transporter protein [Pseudomonadales bacterium]
MKKYWNLFWHFRKIQLMKMMEYRSDFFFWMIVSLMWTAFNYFFYSLIIGNSKNIAGWSYDEVMILLSFFTMIDAFTWSVFYPNMIDYTESIYDGTLSKLLLLPISNVFVILNQNTTYHNIPRFFIGLIVLITTVAKMNINVDVFQILLATLLFLTSIIFIYSGWFILATLAFWVEKLKNINEIMPGFRNVYQMPVSIYTGITSIAVTFIFPLGLVTTLPSEVILGRSNSFNIIYFILFTFIFASLTLHFFNYSIKKYSSVGN